MKILVKRCGPVDRQIDACIDDGDRQRAEVHLDTAHDAGHLDRVGNIAGKCTNVP